LGPAFDDARSRSVRGEAGAHFHAVNTLGALLGTLAAGFALLPYLGMARSTACAAALNGTIGAVCCVLDWRAPIPRGVHEAGQPDLDRSAYAPCSSTATSFDTPRSSMVTP
jgi:hypothetical protein